MFFRRIELKCQNLFVMMPLFVGIVLMSNLKLRNIFGQTAIIQVNEMGKLNVLRKLVIL